MPSTRESIQIGLRRWLKSAVLGAPLLGSGAGAELRRRLHRDYERRADDYARRAREAGLSYDEKRTEGEVRARLKKRGWSPTRRTEGDVHTFAFIPGISWHDSLLPDLQALGPVSRFDYAALGYSWDEFVRGTRRGLRERDEMNDAYVRQGEDARYGVDDAALRALGWRNRRSFDREIGKIVRHYRDKVAW